ncbi:MAG TPA: UDP-N-acetylmuramoyl-L-alanyl-D-glutamate--2,6-diaminopimelate ligase [Burkholderiales bacterium]|nr:UDP-N-acetylmuramoyl-L-alanyl-D-glutamate--2,6-diaminopimelate ligase [Burkholderiales bacterium]
MDLFQRLAAQGAMIERLAADSRRCRPGTAFFAYPGEKADGRAYIGDALARGASAVLWDADNFAWSPAWRVPNGAVHGLKQRAGELAAEFHGQPSRALWMCGVTGTNGKTSCSHWIAAALEASGIASGIIGTLGVGLRGALRDAGNTTPDALELQATLAELRAAGARAVAMEVSSHGLAQGRVNGVRFACALFTNLSHDHLDYHGSMQAYAEAKAQLFVMPGLDAAVLNLDDAFGRELARRLAGRVRRIGYAIETPVAGASDEFIALEPSMQLVSSWGRAELATRQIGRFNLSNVLGVLGCLMARGMAFADAVRLLAELPAVPGRMEQVGERPLVIVDYAHTPDALEKVLAALQPVAAQRGGRLSLVFGAGGDRDPAKRPVMGAVAERGADRVIITSDNPRSEDPLRIIEAIAGGMRAVAPREPDRRRAIERAVLDAAPQDVVLIAGKGHESYQEIAGRRLPFSDQAVARAALALRGGR